MKIKIENKDGRAQNTRVYSMRDGKEIDITNAGQFYNTKVEIPANSEIEINLIGRYQTLNLNRFNIKSIEFFIDIVEGNYTDVLIKKLENLEGKNG